jgi:hypothetical protein
MKENKLMMQKYDKVNLKNSDEEIAEIWHNFGLFKDYVTRSNPIN